jgi:hypothetical protein
MIVSGKIVGNIDPTLLDDHPVIFAEQEGNVVKSTVPDSAGNFILLPLQQSSTVGNYDVVIVADDHATAMIQSIPVTAQGTTRISDSTNPISLDDSAAHTVSGTVDPVSAEATIRALQTFSAGPTMEVRSVSANLLDGGYTLTLPMAAPSLGTYAGSLPIPLTADPSLAGTYQIEASADGHVTQTADVDVSGGDAVQDFTLAP